ncbi:glycoside hydrolase family 43 protein [uncultured Draconibacterium sp.]|uniref:glycoside hydrolase family 43 protein n=1 Tax=uncultured Draconibacterium sp. TaxID=1573823 RepID=UPI0025FACCC4|nr:glycoside hydrolase family 43 protein [uncultured Draconibacterium sp.]
MIKQTIFCGLLLLFFNAVTFGQSKKPLLTDEDYITPYNAVVIPDSEVTYNNPVIPGFYPDPSVCRVGDDYYLVTSTFEYFPGVPVFHSKDLINWEKIGYCIDRDDQLPKPLNVFAPNIQYHNGTFYMITTNFGEGGGNFYVTAKDPAGPWSDPIWVDIRGIDPDLFFDDDGKTYIINSFFMVYEIDLETGKILDEGRKLWYGNGGSALEGPHIYKKDGYYYILAAEGGTAEGHHVTMARALNLYGPYISNPANPVLAHENAAGQLNELHGIGHADIIHAHDGSWWMSFHGYRLIGNRVRGYHHTLGRETCMVPMEWPTNSWPVVNGNGTATLKMHCPTLPLQEKSKQSSHIDFDNPELGMEWNYIQAPLVKNYSLSERKGFLRLKGAANNIGENGSPTFVGRRVQHIDFRATTVVDFDPESENEEAGLTLVNHGTHFDISVKTHEDERVVQVQLEFGTNIYKSKSFSVKSGPVKLRIEGDTHHIRFLYAQNDNDFIELDSVVTSYISSETVGGYSGVYVGMFASGNGKISKVNADFDWFEYLGKEN